MKALGVVVALAAVAGAAVAAVKFAPALKEKVAAKKAAKSEEVECECECEDADAECACECEADEAAVIVEE